MPMFSKLFFRLAYLGRPIWDTGVSPPELMDFINTSTPGRALDLGCGTGTNAITLAQRGWQVTGVDFTPQAIRRARRKVIKNHVAVELLHEDVLNLPLEIGKFDLILDLGCFHSQPAARRRKYILKINQLLADTGTYLLYTFIKNEQEESGPGITEADIRFIDENLCIVDRKDGTERGFRPSAWLTIKKRKSNDP